VVSVGCQRRVINAKAIPPAGKNLPLQWLKLQ